MVQRMNEAKSGIWLPWMRREICEKQQRNVPKLAGQRAAVAAAIEMILASGSGYSLYAAPNLTDTSFDTPGSCMVTP